MLYIYMNSMKKLILRIYFFAFLAAFLMLLSRAEALEINGYDPNRNDRFLSGTFGTSNPVPNSNFIGSSYDWSGVGWQSDFTSRNVALVSPEHFVAANHWKIPEGSSVSFLNRDGQLKTYTVQKYTTFDYTDQNGAHIPDLALGWLTQAIPDSDHVSHYSVINADNPKTPSYDTSWYAGKEIYVYGWYARAGTNTLDSFGLVKTTGTATPDNTTLCAEYDGYHGTGAPDEAICEGWDSGGPSFIAWNGRLTVVGTHFAISDNGNLARDFDDFVPAYVNNMDLAMAGTGYSVDQIYMVPEPATVLLLLAGLPYLLRRHRR